MSQGIGGSTAEHELAALRRWPQQAARIGAEERAHRLKRARALMADAGVDALVINAGASLRYFSGLPWAPTERLIVLLVRPSGPPVLVCPQFELGSVEAGLGVLADVRTWEEHDSPHALLADSLREVGARRIAVDPQMPFCHIQALRQAAPGVELIDAAPVIDGCRMHKSQAELALIRQAMAMTLEVHRRAAAILRPGVSTANVRRFIDEAHRALGADNGSTFCAVQFGQATCYPHGVPGEQLLARGDLVLIDTGCTVDGYHSDITRTYVFGAPTVEQSAVWQLEREAQQAAFDAVRPGYPCETVDAAARTVLTRAGFGPDYRLPGLPHRTGHGIGLAIHEAAYLVRGDRTPLAPGMCFSNEPMIVVPGRFGIRLEDHFHVTERGAQWFTPPSPSLAAPFG
ncbi:M24 family metallopeptidase [Agrilutibacter solisilvae]|uniref:Aminopeptidase P family protein n=1 Tax=Agrilutibacter solisilvae TaxID=2763317 RepID=A0A974Y177_9GAMM|nr:Xaa-Pro peptidase family protein [Lysobacter solisilvae]QSX79439.1 aminopeptidase P family protein [Lysobacter solisilvae]